MAATAIKNRSMFSAVVRSIRADLDALDTTSDADLIPRASGILADADRVVVTIDESAEAWVERECQHLDWNGLVDALDKLRDDYSGRSADAVAARARAEQRRTERLISHRARTARAQASLARRQAEREAVEADPSITSRKALAEALAVVR